MKTVKTIVVMAVVAVFAGCKPNVPDQQEEAHQLLIGPWKVEKETVTNGDGFDGVFTRQVNDDITYVFSETTMQLVSTTGYYLPKAYTLQQQKDGTWLLTVEGYHDKQQNLDGGCSPITIHKITRSNMEWEYEIYGGDEGPVGYYQYLTKINLYTITNYIPQAQ